MFEARAKQQATGDARQDVEENHQPRKPRPTLSYALLSTSYLTTYTKYYHRSYSAAERDKDFFRRQTLLKTRQWGDKENRDKGR